MSVDRLNPGPDDRKSPAETRVERIAEAHKEDIRRIEQLKLKDDGMQRAQIIFVLLGEQSAVDIFLYPSAGSAEEITPVLQQAGLSVRQQEMVHKKGWKFTVLCVARTPEVAEELWRTHPTEGYRTKHEAYARLMGFPQTAIEAFLNRIPRLPENEQDAIEDSDLIVNIIFSKDHWKEELEFLREKSRIIRRYAPRLYKEIMDRRRAPDPPEIS